MTNALMRLKPGQLDKLNLLYLASRFVQGGSHTGWLFAGHTEAVPDPVSPSGHRTVRLTEMRPLVDAGLVDVVNPDGLGKSYRISNKGILRLLDPMALAASEVMER